MFSRFLFALRKARSFVRSIQWCFGKERRLFFLFNESNNAEKNPLRVEKENQKKQQRLTVADCAVVVLKRSFEILVQRQKG